MQASWRGRFSPVADERGVGMWGTEAPLGSGTIVRAAERPVLTRAELIRKLVDEAWEARSSRAKRK